MPPRRSRCWCSRSGSLRARRLSRRLLTGSGLWGKAGRSRWGCGRRGMWRVCSLCRVGGRFGLPDKLAGMGPTVGMSGRARATRSRMSWWWCGPGRCGCRCRWGASATPWGDRRTGTTAPGSDMGCPTGGMSGRARATRSRMSWWWCGPGRCGCRCRWGASATPWGDRRTGTTAPAGSGRCWCGHMSSWSVGSRGGALTTCCQKSTAVCLCRSGSSPTPGPPRRPPPSSPPSTRRNHTGPNACNDPCAPPLGLQGIVLITNTPKPGICQGPIPAGCPARTVVKPAPVNPEAPQSRPGPFGPGWVRAPTMSP